MAGCRSICRSCFRTSVRATGQGFGFNFGRILAAIGVLQVGNLLKVVHRPISHLGSLIVPHGQPLACSIDRAGLSRRHGDHLARPGNARQAAAGMTRAGLTGLGLFAA